MNPFENLHYAIGQLACAVAFADGKIQKEEREKFHAIVVNELKNHDYGFDISDVVFQVLEKNKMDSETLFNWGMKEIKTNSHYLSPELKQKFITVMEKVAHAYPPVTDSETSLLNMFKKEITNIHGDPVFYNKKTS